MNSTSTRVLSLRRCSTRTAFATITMTGKFTLCEHAFRVLTTADPLEKVQLTQEAANAWKIHRLVGDVVAPPMRPARPEKPVIVTPAKMPTAKSSNSPTNVFYLHGLAHVELNAIDLCFDTMLRFADDDVRSYPDGSDTWFDDWISIASDEARHFSMLHERLERLGSFYGELPAHGVIWDGAESSTSSRRSRLAIGQLVAEARGLDAGPRLAERLVGTGDGPSAAIVRIIADEEIRHVRIGVKWFLWECERTGLDAIKEFHNIALALANPGSFSPPFNEERRASAGLTPEWYLPVSRMMREMKQESRLQKSNLQEARNKSSCLPR